MYLDFDIIIMIIVM